MGADRVARRVVKAALRFRVGRWLHLTGLYRRYLPLYCPRPGAVARRLQSYLMHHYWGVERAEGELDLPELGLRVACDLKDHMLWHHLEGLVPLYEHTEIAHVRGLVEPGDHVVDVGANHGFWGFGMLARAGTTGRLSLFEPNPVLQTRIRRTMQLNAHLSAQLLPYAVGDGSADELVFYAPVGNLSGLGSTVLHDMARTQGWLKDTNQIRVPSVSLDQCCTDGRIARMDVLKIDVEHAEDAVLRGALQALDALRPRLIMIETSPDSFASTRIRALGYSGYALDAQGRRQAVPEDHWGNIFFER